MNSKHKNTLVITTASYPYGGSEQFFHNEVLFYATKFDQVILFPLSRPDNDIRDLPDNVVVNESLFKTSREIDKLFYIQNSPLVFKIIRTELSNNPSKKDFIKSKKRDLSNSVLQCLKLSKVYLNEISKIEGDVLHYSFWMNDGALLLSILKSKRKINRFYFRVNGYDLFDERHKGDYMPFKFFNYSQVDKVFVLSEVGLKYLNKRAVFPEKVELAYYGLNDNGINPFDPEVNFTIVSCSGMIPLKRIDKIIDALSLIDFECRWIHFGGGPLREELTLKAKSQLPENIQWEFKGNVPNSEIINFYKTESVNLFMHMSDTEGLCLAIVEAQSFGIPGMAVITGGVADVVKNNKSGVEINIRDTPETIKKHITNFKSGRLNSSGFRSEVKSYWKDKFNAKTNYEFLYKEFEF